MAGIGVTSALIAAGCRVWGEAPVVCICAKYMLSKRTWTSGANVPQKPRKPSGTFMLFSQEKRQNVISDNPDLRFPEIAKIIGRMWRELSDSEKESYRFQARKNMEKYMDEMETFKANLTPDDVQMMEQQARQSKISKAKRKHKQEMKKLEKPKRPLTAYSIFLQFKLKNATGNASDNMVAVGREWKKMSEEDKTVYIDSAAKSKQEYNRALVEWESKMVQQGNESVVRQQSHLPEVNRRKTFQGKATDHEDQS